MDMMGARGIEIREEEEEKEEEEEQR
ncbi:hypothetical protein E2C01_047359 [Portunus trituberculatus]|uniref:Uncharacterized protein n=1 Tax=Portunus trituberculatus TaxID=210409 RepID=A0A5B7G7I4_PORTR|nr:hypothetical protein [Portunus trituberculatus]